MRKARPAQTTKRVVLVLLRVLRPKVERKACRSAPGLCLLVPRQPPQGCFEELVQRHVGGILLVVLGVEVVAYAADQSCWEFRLRLLCARGSADHLSR